MPDAALIAENKRWIREDPAGAHKFFFAEWHDDEFSPAHFSLIADLWSAAEQHQVIVGFRGFGKSTLTEERVALAAVLETEFQCCLFVGPSEERAKEHLIEVASALKMEARLMMFREQKEAGGADTQTYLQLSRRRSILAVGRGQNIRGIKKSHRRPDLVVVDDFEDEENVLTVEGRRGMVRWFLRTLRLACHPRARVIVLCTIMHPDCVPLQLVRHAGFARRNYPVSYIDQNGDERATWEARFPMAWVAAERERYRRLGEFEGWQLEMMCDETAAQEAGDFKLEYFRSEPRVRVWEPVWIAVDPARSTNSGSATTGIVAFSWIGTELVVWEDRTGFYKPSEIIEIIFELNERYRPVAVAFEEDGLNLWATELIRSEAAKRGIFLPVQAVKAPRDRDKFSFIRGLEPHFRNREVVFNGDFPLLREQFLGFPRGRIDGPNALAYSLIVRPGLPVFDNFVAAVHVSEHIMWPAGEPLWLALGATGAYVTGCLVGCAYGRIAVLADWLREGDPGAVAADVVREALLLARKRVNVVAGPVHFQEWNNVGLCQAVRRIPAEIRQGGSLDRGRDYIRSALSRLVRDVPALRVCADARWTLCGISSGYARRSGKSDPETGVYRTLMESLESLLGLMALGNTDDDAVWSYTDSGRRYRKYSTAFERVH